jgi:hypothetical protein
MYVPITNEPVICISFVVDQNEPVSAKIESPLVPDEPSDPLVPELPEVPDVPLVPEFA